MSNDTTTPEQEVNNAPEETVNDQQETEETTETSAEETVGTYQEEETTDTTVPENVPKARLDKEIKRRKDLEKQLEEMKANESGSTDSETGDEPDVKKLAAELAEIKEKEKREALNVALDKGLAKALEDNPEFKDVANTDVVKQMAMNPANKDKTFSQLLEEAYGNALGGKRTTETTTPRGGTADTKVDMNRAKQDAEYRREVLADPSLREQYNAQREIVL